MSRMHNPPHPGNLLAEVILPETGLNITQAAQALGVSRKTLSAILNGRQGISAEMALRITKAFGGDPQMWLSMQDSYDLWQAKQSVDLSHIQRVSAA
ncbi:MAG TPA: HigA family addiction module antitoxin [Pseudomonadales bacterium]|jgi:addiction module HigA family antidote|nr:HigA family addiction module antidote protein [Cellvibrionales bacterium]HRG51025.1 HigA family addiction module antitoxin [Pseudomonadales bacterium]